MDIQTALVGEAGEHSSFITSVEMQGVEPNLRLVVKDIFGNERVSGYRCPQRLTFVKNTVLRLTQGGRRDSIISVRTRRNGLKIRQSVPGAAEEVHD